MAVPGPWKTIFSTKTIGKIEKQPNICEKSYKICAKSNFPRGRREAPPPWGAAEGGACCFWHIFCMIFHICLAVFLFSNGFCRKYCFPRPHLSRPRFQVTEKNNFFLASFLGGGLPPLTKRPSARPKNTNKKNKLSQQSTLTAFKMCRKGSAQYTTCGHK